MIVIAHITFTWTLTLVVENHERNEAKERLLGYAPSYAVVIEKLGHEKLNFETATTDSTYQSILEYQKAWVSKNPYIADIYTMRKTTDGKIAFVVDSETDYNRDGVYDQSREARTPVGEVYSKYLPELEQAFLGAATFTSEPYTDKWGDWVSAFVPLRNHNGNVDAILGIDFPASKYTSYVKSSRNFIFVSSALVFVLIVIGLLAKERHQEFNDKLSSALEKAEDATKAKSDFLANMSHEIRTPLNGILGMINLVEDQHLNVTLRRQIKVIKSCCDSLLYLINDILDFSKIEARKLDLENLPFDVEETIADVVDILAPIAEKKGLDLKINFNLKNSSKIISDQARLRQVLFNLIANAIKFTSKGTVTVTGHAEVQSGNTAKLLIDVHDTGEGIPPEAIKKLFHAFTQADASTTRRHGGTGLGLAICKGIIQALGGHISVKSQVGVGSTFSISFLTLVSHDFKATQTKIIDSRLATKKPYNILVVDDNPTNNYIATSQLKKLGYHADSASNGLEALDAFNSKSYDIVFMDCQMPVLDGFQTTKKLKCRFTTEYCPWIVAMTASTSKEDQKKCYDHGMNDFLAKPFNVHDLSHAIVRAHPPTLRVRTQKISSSLVN